MNKNRWDRVWFEKWRKHLGTLQALITVKKNCHVDRKAIRRLRPIAGLVGDDVFRLNLRISEQLYFSGAGKGGERYLYADVSPRRRSAGARNGSPERPASARRSRQGSARLIVEAAYIVVLEFRTDVQSHTVRLQCNLILYEYAE